MPFIINYIFYYDNPCITLWGSLKFIAHGSRLKTIIYVCIKVNINSFYRSSICTHCSILESGENKFQTWRKWMSSSHFVYAIQSPRLIHVCVPSRQLEFLDFVWFSTLIQFHIFQWHILFIVRYYCRLTLNA